jgi:predicted deacylase
MPPTVIRREINLAELAVPFVEITGSADGPTLTVLAGMHGCEYASMAGVRRWLGDLAVRNLRGRVRAVPVLNVTAFAARSPFVVPEDGKNLNRCFPGDPAPLPRRRGSAVSSGWGAMTPAGGSPRSRRAIRWQRARCWAP